MDSFVQGFVTGQFVLALLLIIVARIFFLRDTEDMKKEIRKRRLKSLPATMPPSSLLSHLGHDPDMQESCSWVGVLVAQLLSHVRNDPIFLKDCLDTCHRLLNRKKMSMIGEMTVTEIHLGDGFPKIHHASIVSIDGGIMVEFDMEYNDHLTMTIETLVLMNWPRLDIAALPVCLSVSMSCLCGKVSLKF
jgi:maintenance of morphology protein 1